MFPLHRCTRPFLVLGLASLTFVLSGCGSSVAANSGSSSAPAVTLSPTSLTFAGQSVSTSSPTQSVTLTNSGTASLVVSGITASGDFTATNNCTSAPIAAAATCTIQVSFAVTATGSRTGTLTVNSNAATAATATLSGTGIASGAVSVAPGSLTFPSTYLTTTSVAQNITITNNVSTAVYVQAPTVTGDFRIATSTCGTSLAAGASCNVSIVFAPTAAGARAGVFTVNDGGGSQVIALTGAGLTLPVGSFPGSSFSGKVRAGITTPIIGASVQLYATGTTGNGSQAVALLSTPLTTDSNGTFPVASGYNCPSATSQIYALASGGKPGAAGTVNSAITLIAPLGICSQITSSTSVVLNEATTAATAWAMSQFLASGGNLGASATNTLGVANGVASVNNLVNLSVGTAPGTSFPTTTATAPTARIHSLANLLNACVLSSAACTTLFTNTTVSGSLAPPPANTLDAALNLVRHPGANVAALFNLSQTSSAFTPALTVMPLDWTLYINYGGGGMNAPSGIGVDSSGNVWVASYFSVLSKFTTTGQPVFPAGITHPLLYESYGLAIDPDNNIWIPNEERGPNFIGSVTVFNSSGTLLRSTGAGGVNYPVAIAADNNGTMWVVQYGNSHISLFDSTLTPLSGTLGYGSPFFDFPVAVAIDGNHNGYIANQSDSTITKVSPNGSQITNIACCGGASGLAVDQANNVWVANYYGNSVSEVAANGSVLHASNITGGGINHPQGIAVDGAGNVWVANYRGSSLTQVAGSSGAILSPSAGWAPDSAMLEGFAVAIDSTGNIWISDFGSLTSNYTITEFVGLAAPIKTPLLGPPQAP